MSKLLDIDRGVRKSKDDRNSLIIESIDIYKELVECEISPEITVSIYGATSVKVYTKKTKAKNWLTCFIIDCIRTDNRDLVEDIELKSAYKKAFSFDDYDKFLESMNILVDTETWENYINLL